MVNARMRLLHPVQQETFPVETKCSLKQSPVSNFSKLSQFSHLIQPQGLVRATCRTRQLTIYIFDAKHQVLLDNCHSAER